jgi:hypothetical protein
MGQTALLPLRRKACFFALKNPTASAVFEPANLGTKGQHATSRPPKPYMLIHENKHCTKSTLGFMGIKLRIQGSAVQSVIRGAHPAREDLPTSQRASKPAVKSRYFILLYTWSHKIFSHGNTITTASTTRVPGWGRSNNLRLLYKCGNPVVSLKYIINENNTRQCTSLL